MTTPSTAAEDTGIMRRDSILARARSAIGKGTVYSLGKGGRNPAAPLPGDEDNRCDCSAFAAWACGLHVVQSKVPLHRRYNGGRLTTSSIIYDARRPQTETGLFTIVPAPDPGDFVAYPWKDGKPGHIACVSEFDPVWFWAGLVVIDCSSTNSKQTGDAIRERSGAFFGRHASVFVRYTP